MAQVFLGLGSNMNKTKNLVSALQVLETKFEVKKISDVYRSAAVGFDGADFFNLVVEVATELCVADLSLQLKKIEAEHGRCRDEKKFSARTLDIDILTYDQHIGVVSGVELPRHEIEKYAFVLRPLAEISGSDIHPQTGLSYAQLWQQFDPQLQPLTLVTLKP